MTTPIDCPTAEPEVSLPPAQGGVRRKKQPLGVNGPIRNSKMDLGRAMQLRFKGLTYAEIGDLLQVSPTTVMKGLDRFNKILANPAELNLWRENQIAFLESLDMELALGIARTSLSPKSSVNNLAFAKDKIFQHLRLLKGESTSNISNVTRLILAAHEEENVHEQAQEHDHVHGHDHAPPPVDPTP